MTGRECYHCKQWVEEGEASCYVFVRPKKSFLEVCLFLGRTVKVPQVRRADRASKAKVAHIIQIRHRDQVEAPFTEWLQEAYEFSDVRSSSR